jgi:antirestriction protein ArdC
MSDLYHTITQQMISALERGVIPWIKPWRAPDAATPMNQPYPINAITQRPYAGINIPLLWSQAATRGFTQDRWLTYRQAKSAGGYIRSGEHCTLAVLYKPMEREAKDAHGQVILDEQGQPTLLKFAVLKRHFLFNIEQTVDVVIPVPEAQHPNPMHMDGIQAADHLLNQSGARIVHRASDMAFYHPHGDLIQLPLREQFQSAESYYATAFHELTHWTGHAARLHRDGIVQHQGYGSPSYAFEELVAEMGAAFLCAQTGIRGELRHAGYINTWLSLLRSDTRVLFLASGQAREASEYVLSLGRDTDALSGSLPNSVERLEPSESAVMEQ